VTRLLTWLNNFSTDEEKYFGACILDNLIYRSEQQTVALIRQLLERNLSDLTRRHPTPIGPIQDWLELLRTDPSPRHDLRLRLVVVVHRDDPPTKSAYVIARLMKRYLHVNANWIITPWSVADSINQGIRVFVYIDDFLGTGDQFSTVATLERLDSTFGHSYSVYAPLSAHVAGVSNLTVAWPQLKVAPVDFLDRTHSVFDDASLTFDDGKNTPAAAKAFYLDLLVSRGITLSGCERRGYGGLELAYAFSHAVPDNCLPLLWYGDSSKWQPLFDR